MKKMILFTVMVVLIMAGISQSGPCPNSQPICPDITGNINQTGNLSVTGNGTVAGNLKVTDSSATAVVVEEDDGTDMVTVNTTKDGTGVLLNLLPNETLSYPGDNVGLQINGVYMGERNYGLHLNGYNYGSSLCLGTNFEYCMYEDGNDDDLMIRGQTTSTSEPSGIIAIHSADDAVGALAGESSYATHATRMWKFSTLLKDSSGATPTISVRKEFPTQSYIHDVTCAASTDVFTSPVAHSLVVGHTLRIVSATGTPCGIPDTATFYTVCSVPAATTFTIDADADCAGADFDVDANETADFQRYAIASGTYDILNTKTAHGFSGAGAEIIALTHSTSGLSRGTPYYVCTVPNAVAFKVDDAADCLSEENLTATQGGSSEAIIDFTVLGSGIYIKKPTTIGIYHILASNGAYGTFSITSAGVVTDLIAATNGAGDDAQTGFTLADNCNGSSGLLCLYDGGTYAIIDNDTGTNISIIIDATLD